ncbi:hypothetical protein [Hymenobacter chitinivorans]|uniref:Uncharacterized protein n=1 Tax=Hymenobacter chitinivorans DSM 11115 TaxID=1121954 RepID=A0A2M9ASS0_9BACT|nr:hypothetical protein [Hymenobacter chitinivorans]PJJ48736.1 hypothetical protein CLV45_4446 [Hymenobacter chitinivorans DSM 11115]
MPGDSTPAQAWWTPLVGASLAVTYELTRQLLRNWLLQTIRAAHARPIFTADLLREQLIHFLLYFAFGSMLLLILSWRPSPGQAEVAAEPGS